MCHTTLCISTYFFPHNHGSVSSSTSAQQSQLRREGFANRTLGKERTIFRCSNGSLLVNRNIRSAEFDMAEKSVVIPPWPMDGKGDIPTPTPSYICLLPWLMAVFFFVCIFVTVVDMEYWLPRVWKKWKTSWTGKSTVKFFQIYSLFFFKFGFYASTESSKFRKNWSVT